MTPGSDNFESLLDAYLAGTLPPEELARFERALDADPALAAQAQLQREVDASLRRTHAAPRVPLPIPRALDFKPGARPRRLIWIAALAAAVVVAVGVRVAMNALFNDSTIIPPEKLYARMDSTGFVPPVTCNTDEEFIKFVKGSLGEPLVPAAAPGVKILGWGYKSDYEGSPISDQTLILLTTADEHRVVVLMDKKTNDRTLKLPRGSKLHLFRRVIGGIVLYEITPLEQSRIIDLIHTP